MENPRPAAAPQGAALPLISVTTVTRNCGGTVARALESVLVQGYPRVEYVVMDGGSTDGTFDVIRSYAPAFADAGIDYRFSSGPDAGMYDALNKAMDRTTGDVVGNINGDDRYEPGAFLWVAAAYEAARFDVLYGDVRINAGAGSFVKRARPMGAWPSSRHWNHPTMFLAGPARALRYRTDNPYADFDLFLRAQGAGMKVEVLDEVLATFEFGGMSTRKSLADVRERIGWKSRVFRDNGCPPMSYVEGAAIEIAKYIRA